MVILAAVGAAVVACVVGILIAARKRREATKSAAAGGTESAGADATNMYHRMAGWYNDAPESAGLRASWGRYPTTPRALEAWPGFVAVTNAFLDARDGTASTEVLPAEESAPEEEESWSARGLQRLALWRTEDPPEEEEIRAKNATTPAEEEI